MDYQTAKALMETLREMLLSPTMFKYPKTAKGKLNLAMSLYVTSDANGEYYIESSHPAFRFLDQGVRPRHQIELLDKVVPIKTSSGKVIFRKATVKSFREMKWRHSGIPAQNYVEKAIELFNKRNSIQKQNLAKQAIKKFKGILR